MFHRKIAILVLTLGLFALATLACEGQKKKAGDAGKIPGQLMKNAESQIEDAEEKMQETLDKAEEAAQQAPVAD